MECKLTSATAIRSLSTEIGFALCDPVTFRPNIKWVAKTHDGLYPCDKFGDCSFSHFGSILWTDTQTDADERLTPATLVA